MEPARSGQDRAHRARRAALLVAAALVVAGAWLLVPDPPGSAAVDDERAVASSEGDETFVQLTAVDASASTRLAAETSASSRVEVEARAPLEIDLRAPGTSAKPARPVDSGKLTLRAVDAVTREPLDHLRVRTASAERIADRNAGPGVTRVALTLTPDTYTPLVIVPGYEPVELESIRVEDGAEIELTASMHRGSASITGVVIGSGSASHAELAGLGRHPCARCAESATDRPSHGKRATRMGDGWSRTDPCAQCGFAADFTRIPIGPAATFVFTDLASGTYALRLTDDRGHGDGALLLVALLEAQHVRVEMTAPVLRDVLVNMIDVDQLPLADAWGANVRATAAADRGRPASFDSVAPARQLEWRITVFADSEFFGRGEILTPTRPTFSDARPAPFGGRKLGTGRAVDDRTRGPDEALMPKAGVPKFPEAVLETIVREDGLVRIEGVPAHELTIRLTCEPFLATATVPVSTTTAIVRAQLERIADGTNVPATFRALDAARYR